MRTILLGLAFLSWLANSRAQKTTPDSLTGFIRQKGDSVYKNGEVPGLFIGVLNGGQKRYFNFGYSIPDSKLPFDSATLFEAGSITKTFTAFIAEAVLQQKGLTDSATIGPYLPDSVQTNKALAGIRFLSLLNHTSGLPRLPGNIALNTTTPYDAYTPDLLFSYLKNATPQPDGRSNYSNLGVGLAGVLAERISGKTYAALLQEIVMGPFGIRKPGATPSANKSQGYFGEQKAVYWNMNALAPAGGLQATATEMLTYLQYMSQPAGKGAKAIIETLLQPTVSISPKVQVARAWHTLEQTGKPRIYWHNGGTYGFSTFAAFVRETGQAVIVVVNKYNTNAISDGVGIAIMKKMVENKGDKP